MANFQNQLTRLCLLMVGALSSSALGDTCVVEASATNSTDDAPAILAAFDKCGQGGTITFAADTTYYVNSVMSVSGLQDAVIDIQGELLVSTKTRRDERDVPAKLTWDAVEHRYSILVGQLPRCWLSEPVDRIHCERRQRHNPRTWSRHLERERRSLVRVHRGTGEQVELPGQAACHHAQRSQQLRRDGSELLEESDVVRRHFSWNNCAYAMLIRERGRTMSIIYSHNVTLDSIFVNNTVTSGTAG